MADIKSNRGNRNDDDWEGEAKGDSRVSSLCNQMGSSNIP